MTTRTFEPDPQIFSLARNAGMSDESLQTLYAETVRELSTDARIADYVHLLACRRLKATLVDEPSSPHAHN
jgi:hypothetical protein